MTGQWQTPHPADPPGGQRPGLGTGKTPPHTESLVSESGGGRESGGEGRGRREGERGEGGERYISKRSSDV